MDLPELFEDCTTCVTGSNLTGTVIAQYPDGTWAPEKPCGDCGGTSRRLTQAGAYIALVVRHVNAQGVFGQSYKDPVSTPRV